MAENKYDEQAFFDKYSEMNRSKNGLQGAGEWEALKQILPDFTDKRVLDLGCGYGWHCNYAAEKGARSVIGVDISRKMLEVAKEKTDSSRVEYIQQSIEAVDYRNESFDIILSSLAFHYVEDYQQLVKNIHRMLDREGVFIFTVEHPIFTAHGSQDWHYKNNEIQHFPVDNYFYEGKRSANFLGETVTKYHRTVTTYVNTLLTNGFKLNHVIEPTPLEAMMDVPGMKEELRRPMMLIISATKL